MNKFALGSVFHGLAPMVCDAAGGMKEKEGRKGMILTVTLNPAVDKTCELGTLLPGEVNRLTKSSSVAGGKGINVTKVLRQFHMPVAAVGFLGGSGGKLIEDAMEKMGVECHFTKIKGDTRTNVNVLAKDGTVTELLEPGPEILLKELESFRKQFSGCLERCELVVLSGSVPTGVPVDIYGQLIEECRRAGRKVCLDASGEVLKEGVKAKPDIVKPNQKELEYLAGKSLIGREELVTEAGKLIAGGIGKVILSMGADGLMYVDGEQQLYQAARKVQAVNTVGCGDTVVASLCMSELAGEEPDILLRKAAAMAAANALIWENGRISMDTYLELL